MNLFVQQQEIEGIQTYSTVYLHIGHCILDTTIQHVLILQLTYMAATMIFKTNFALFQAPYLSLISVVTVSSVSAPLTHLSFQLFSLDIIT